MKLDVKELNGKYSITTSSNHKGLIENKSNGVTVFENGHTKRTDEAGCIWTHKLDPINDKEVVFTSTADPRNANCDFCIPGENGQLTRDPVTFETVLKLDRMGEKIRMTGQIQHGATTTMVTLMKII